MSQSPAITALCFILIVSLILVIRNLLIIKKQKEEIVEKYKPIIDIEEKKDELEKEIEELLSEMDTVKRKYSIGLDRFNDLSAHISALEESAELLDFGLYKPHFDFETTEEYKEEISRNYEQQKEMIKSDNAVLCPSDWTVNGSKIEGRKMTKQNMKVMLRAFNGECDAAIAKVRWDNSLKMEERILKSYEAINKSGQVNKISITDQYLQLKLDELHLAFELAEKQKEEKEEQRRIQEEMREEEKARKEFERAKIEAEKEEERYQKALEKARIDIEKLTGEKADAMAKKIADLEKSLSEAKSAKERAISQAQLTKSGYVYIISNIGSFGNDIYKIGMTRRLNPMDRVRELGDASVPFSFDVHAMIYSENAPDLEHRLHRKFNQYSVNLVNMRKEFFNISLEEIIDWAREVNQPIQLTKIAEAKEYHESMRIRNDKNSIQEVVARFSIPENPFEND